MLVINAVHYFEIYFSSVPAFVVIDKHLRIVDAFIIRILFFYV